MKILKDRCQNCIYSEKDINKGLICKLTNDLATFEKYCDKYSVNNATIKKNIKQDLEKSDNITFVMNICEYKKSKLSKKELPNEPIIKQKKIPNAIFYILALDLLSMLLLFWFNIFEIYTISIILFTSILPITFLFASASDQAIKMIVRENFIEIAETKIEYNNLISFYLEQYEKTAIDNSKVKYLVFRDKNNVTDFYLRLVNLNYNYRQIIKKIIEYKDE